MGYGSIVSMIEVRPRNEARNDTDCNTGDIFGMTYAMCIYIYLHMYIYSTLTYYP